MPGQVRKALRAFRVKDLMISLVPGGTSIPTDEGGPLPTPITPVATTALISPKIRAFRKIATLAQPINSEFMDRFAQEIGYDVLGQALCTSDMPTSPTLPPPVCWRAIPISDQVLMELQADCQLMLAHIEERQAINLAQARENREELLPQLQEVIKELEI